MDRAQYLIFKAGKLLRSAEGGKRQGLPWYHGYDMYSKVILEKSSYFLPLLCGKCSYFPFV